MAAALKKKFGVEVEFIESGGGVFEVTADGQLIFSKRKLGRFPEEKEVLDQIEAMNGKS